MENTWLATVGVPLLPRDRWGVVRRTQPEHQTYKYHITGKKENPGISTRVNS
jgi:hypothetical protein